MPTRRARKGVILVIVVAFLALGLSVGIAFVFFAHQMATNMRMYREAGQGGRTATVNQGSSGYTDEAPPMPTELASMALGNLIYDVPDDETGIWNSLRGASLARGIYGLSYGGAPQNPTYANNDVPYNGIGRLRSAAGSYCPALLAGLADGNLRGVNYTYHAEDRFLRDPERVGYRASDRSPAWIIGNTVGTNNYFPLNAPYTYPDEKDLSLGAVRASDGRVLTPSFYRSSTFGSLAPDNPHWQDDVGKYLLQRPRPKDMGPGFPAVPANADGSYTGDLEQLEGKQVRQNDSLWLDLDLPVHKWRGRFYKPLIAFLIIDLDGRINVNVAGNRRGISSRHASNQGWGDWEMDLRQIFQFNEASKLFLDPNGRYGSDGKPNKAYSLDGSSAANNAIPVRNSSPFYSVVDLDGSILTNPGPQVRMRLPQRPSTRTSPQYPPRYADGSVAERADHPSLFNPYLLSSVPSSSMSVNDRIFGPSEMRFLNYKYNNDDAAYQLAELGRLLPQNLGRSCTPGQNGWPASAVNPRYLMTTISNDLDRVGLPPWIYDRRSNYTVDQPNPAADGVFPPASQPSVPGVGFPDLSQRTTSPSPSTNVLDFDPTTWKASKAILGAVDLNRFLADYRVDPTQPFEKPGNVTATSADRALADRQRFAKDIFDRLCTAAGTQLAGAVPGSSQYNALRYLAQLSVNVVDLIDCDDYSTPFVWNPIDANDPRNNANFLPGNLADRVVFGTELPRLCVNEALLRVENGSMVMGSPDYDQGLTQLPPKATFYNVKAWAELHNPLTPGMSSAAALSHQGGAPLTYGGHQVYRLLLTTPNKQLRYVANVKGDPDGTIRKTVNLPAGVYASVNGVVPPSNGAYIQPRGPNSSFYVIGPEATPVDLVVPSAISADMKFQIPAENYNNGENARTTFLLQRLACPPLPPGPANPYITIDLMEFSARMIADGRSFDDQGLIVPPLVGLVKQSSWGKMQPYAGHPSQVVAQSLIPAPIAGLNHTFFRHNGQSTDITLAGLTLTQPFDWLVHLDRPAISPVELFNASAYKPHELTQQFMIGDPMNLQKFQHLADWSSDASRLHRALAMLQTRSLTLGLGAGVRVPGRVNINTIWDEAVFRSVCAHDAGNAFSNNDIQAIWTKLKRSRTKSADDVPSKTLNLDRPFWSTAAPIDANASSQFPTGVGINDTLLRQDPTNPPARLFDVPGTHPYLRHELLNKIEGRLTTRSNVFAVWMTIGYFEVTDRDARPIKLGKELGIDDGTNMRHRFFAVVDRTNLTIDPANPRLQGPRPIFFSYEPVPTASASDPTTPGVVTAVIPAVSFDGTVLRGLYDDSVWELRTNDRLLMDVGVNQESVPIQVVGFTPGIGALIRLTCGLAHSRGCALMIGNTRLGNPGPQPGFNIRDNRYSSVVRLFMNID